MAPRVRDPCHRYGLPYNTGTPTQQTAKVWKRIFHLALPGPKPGDARAVTPPQAAPGTTAA